MTIGGVLADAWRVYRLLFRRSVTVAALIYGAIAALEEGGQFNAAAGILAGILTAVASFGGPVLVQGALVEIVRNVHEGRRPEAIGGLLARAGRRLVPLLGASILYGLGVIFGLLLLIVPGLYVAARWSLMAPAIMLEGHGTWDAQHRSREIVRGQPNSGLGDRTGTALGVVVSSYLLTGLIPFFSLFAIDRGWPHWASVVAQNALAALMSPFAAHVLSVLYYRLVDTGAPAIHPDVQRWRSVWEGPVA